MLSGEVRVSELAAPDNSWRTSHSPSNEAGIYASDSDAASDSESSGFGDVVRMDFSSCGRYLRTLFLCATPPSHSYDSAFDRGTGGCIMHWAVVSGERVGADMTRGVKWHTDSCTGGSAAAGIAEIELSVSKNLYFSCRWVITRRHYRSSVVP